MTRLERKEAANGELAVCAGWADGDGHLPFAILCESPSARRVSKDGQRVVPCRPRPIKGKPTRARARAHVMPCSLCVSCCVVPYLIFFFA